MRDEHKASGLTARPDGGGQVADSVLPAGTRMSKAEERKRGLGVLQRMPSRISISSLNRKVTTQAGQRGGGSDPTAVCTALFAVYGAWGYGGGGCQGNGRGRG